MALTLRKNAGETWLQAALRYAAPYGLDGEVQEWYDRFRAEGQPEDGAAWAACYEWDVLRFEPDAAQGAAQSDDDDFVSEPGPDDDDDEFDDDDPTE